MSAMSDTQNTKVGVEPGGDRGFVKSGGALDIESGGALKISGTDRTAGLNAAAQGTGTPMAGAHTVSAGEDTAGTVGIVTGLSSVDGFNVMILRAGVPIFSDQAVSESAGTITVADGAATYQLTANDVIQWIAIGAV